MTADHPPFSAPRRTHMQAIFIYVVVYNVVIQQRYRRQALDIVGR